MILKSITALAILGMVVGQIPGCSTALNPTAVAAGVQSACSFLPTVTDIETILKANPTITDITTIVAAICSSVVASAPSTTSAHREGVTPPVKQVTVFINGKTYVVHAQ